MTTGHTFHLRRNRETAHRAIDCAPDGSVMTVKPPRRSLDQNALLWVWLSAISIAKPEGRELTQMFGRACSCIAWIMRSGLKWRWMAGAWCRLAFDHHG